MCKATCPQCGFEFEAKPPAPIVNARWTAEENATLLRLYQNERKTIPQIAEEMNRTQDAVRNHLHALREAGKPRGAVTVSVSMTAEEYDNMRAASERESETRLQMHRTERKNREIAEAAYFLLETIKTTAVELPDEALRVQAALEKAVKAYAQTDGKKHSYKNEN